MRMRIEKKKLENFTVNYPLELLAPHTKILFIEIETSDFTAQNSSLYLIRAAYYSGENWYIKR